jgi:hypothetical protein
VRSSQILQLTVLVTWAVVSLGQTGQSAPSLPTGLRIPATLKASLSSQKAKVGDTVMLDCFVDVHGKDGKVVIPAHAALTGVVTQANPFRGMGQPAILAFAAQSVEWKGGHGTLDAAVFGVLAASGPYKPGFRPRNEYYFDQWLLGFGTRGETVEEVPAATLRHQSSLDIVDNRTVGMRPIMQLTLSTDPAIRTYFTSDQQNVELPKEYLVVLLNGMKVVQ